MYLRMQKVRIHIDLPRRPHYINGEVDIYFAELRIAACLYETDQH